MRYRRRTLIPIKYRDVPLGHLQWNGEAMEAWTVDGKLIGTYQTRQRGGIRLLAGDSGTEAGNNTHIN